MPLSPSVLPRLTVLVLMMTAALTLGCAPLPMSDADHKMDHALREAIAASEAGPGGETDRFSVLVRADDVIIREDLEAAGLTVETIAGPVATAHGTGTAIRSAAALPEVQSITLSQEHDLLIP